jgi:hypothetical protein
VQHSHMQMCRYKPCPPEDALRFKKSINKDERKSEFWTAGSVHNRIKGITAPNPLYIHRKKKNLS